MIRKISIATALCAFFTFQFVHAAFFGYVDEKGRVHVSSERPDARFRLLKRNAVLGRDVVRSDSARTLPPIDEASRKRYTPIVATVARKYRLDEALLHAVIAVESRYNPSAVSPRGATGLMQIMPQTAQRYRVRNIYDPHQNISAGARYLRYLMGLFDNDLHLVLAAYNAGHNAVIKYGRTIPPFRETRTYVPRVLAFYKKYQAEI